MQRLPVCIEYSPQQFSKRVRGDMVNIMESMKMIDANVKIVSLWIREFQVYVLFTDVLWALDEYEKREPRANKEWKELVLKKY